MDVRTSQDNLIDVLERMENFFQRLEVYTRVSPPHEMIDIIVKIMVEVLSILGIATKEMKQGRISVSFLYNRLLLISEKLSEKFLRKLIGKAEIEDALKRLDKLTNEEVRMVTAEVLDATHIVNDRVVRVDDSVALVDEGVARVDDRVVRVDDRVAQVDVGVTRVDDRVVRMDDRVAHVDEGVSRVENRVNAIDDRVA